MSRKPKQATLVKATSPSMDVTVAASASIEKYDPVAGVKAIVTAESMEKYFARAKDATGLYAAVELKLVEQRRCVLWWDSEERRGRPEKTSQTSDVFLAGMGLDRQTLHRWRTRLKDERKFVAALESAQVHCVRICEASKGATAQRGASGTNENEWYTPREYVEAARAVLGAIDLDPATALHAQEWIQATRFFTREDDGLQQPWEGRVWLNPPYMQPDISNFVEKLCVEVEAARTTAAVLLTHNYTDTAWFHRAAGACQAICFTRGRIAFLNPEGEPAAPTQGQAFFYFGPAIDVFRTRFIDEGFVVVPQP